MDAIPMACTGTADAAFGPRVSTACRAFDFTLYFEDLILGCLPSAIFLLLSPLYGCLLWREPRRVQRSRLLLGKLVALVVLFACQIAFLFIRQLRSPATQTHASLAVDVLEVLSMACSVVLSYLHHCRSIRPSTLLTLFLSARSLLGIARVRTLWLIPSTPNAAAVFTTGLTLTVLSTFFESRGKESILTPKTVKPATPEPFSGFWKLATFAWLAGTFRQGYAKVLSVHDLPDLDPQLDSHLVGQQLQMVWSHTRDKSAKRALLYACFRAYRASFLSAIIPRLFMMGFTFCQPFLISATVTWVGLPDAAMDSGRGLIGAFALVYMGMAIFTALYGYQIIRFTTRLRGGLISLIHRQTIDARAVDLGEITAITLMGTDVERIVISFRSIHEVWASLIDIAIAVYLLERQVGAACIVPAFIVVVFIAITFGISSAMSRLQRFWVEKVEDRLRLTSYALENIKAVKMLGLSEKMFSLIQALRYTEVAASAAFRKLLVVRGVLSNSPADLAPMATFAVYVIIATVRHDNSILAVRAFTSLSLIALVTNPVLIFIQAVPAVIQCLGSFDRIQEYCSKPAFNSVQLGTTPGGNQNGSSISLKELSKPLTDGKLIEFRGQSLGWGQNRAPVLQNIHLSIPSSAITMVVGPVGSGKSTLLEGILGETITMGESVKRNLPSVAYCSQASWLQSQTVRQNIVGVGLLDTDWYATVVWACGLESDLVRLPQGDQTPVGSNGLALSGGQKQRIALARAVYSRCPVVLLDDVFSGIDATATETITRRLFGDNGIFRKIQAIVVLATHSSFLLQYADHLIVLGEGEVVEAGTLDSLRSSSAYIQALKIGSPGAEIEEWDSRKETDASTSEDNRGSSESLALLAEGESEDPMRQVGDFSVYAYYATASGRTAVLSSLFITLLWAFCREFPTIWLDWWTAANAKDPNSKSGLYLGIYVFLGICSFICLIAACWVVFVNIVSRSAIRLHNDLLASTMRAPFQFFHRVDVGSITNRFSQDMDLIDMALPNEALNTIAAGCTCLVKVVILVAFAKYLGIAVPFVGVVVYMTQKFYLRTSRQMRLLDIEAKAPLYTHFLELVGGAATVRAFKWQESFSATCMSLLNFSQRPVYLLYCVQQCLGFFLDVLVAMLAVILMVIIVFRRDSFDPGDVGVALVMVMTFNSSLMELIKSWTMLETSIGAVSRVKTYVATTEAEEDAATPLPPLPPDWPSSGAIQLSGAVVGHSPISPPVLKGISMSIGAGEKIAICGPSGSGKTTLVLALLRMVEIQEGSISIDGVDLSGYSLAEVRTRLNVVTQDPFLVAGTVRFNIDPFQRASDEVIVNALRRLNLWEGIEREGGLDMPMKPTSWSVGQRQLLCLARAMVRESKVLILDEATSSVDSETEKIMQQVIEAEFSSHTILSVVHRLGSIHRYDRVAVLDSGVLVEFDSPDALLSRPSRFAELYHSAKH